jgi:hypothetical protein
MGSAGATTVDFDELPPGLMKSPVAIRFGFFSSKIEG